MNRYTLNKTLKEIKVLWALSEDMATILSDLLNATPVSFCGTDEDKDNMYTKIDKTLTRWFTLTERM